MNPSVNTQNGGSLIGILVGLGLFSILIVFYMNSTTNQQSARKIAESKELNHAIESAVAHEALTIVKDINPNSCLEISKIINRPFGFGPEISNLKYTKAIPENTTSEPIKKAIERCSHPIFIGKSNVSLESKLYFCMALESNKKNAFVEYSIQFLSTSTNKPLPCNRIFIDRSAIAKVAYGVYFQGTESTYKYGTSLIKINI